MQLSVGDKLGPYEITGLIGKGGMGEVYRGTDTRLGRPVAIKVSSREFNDRFEREAKAISALNHPNICTIMRWFERQRNRPAEPLGKENRNMTKTKKAAKAATTRRAAKA